jgi:beta-glucosidase
VLAFAAGADLILMPADADAAIDGLVAALEGGRIPWARLEQSLARRTAALTGLGSAPEEPVQIALDGLVSAEEQALSRELLELSLELAVAPSGAPALPAGPGVNLIRLDTALNCPFLPAMAPALLRPAAAGYGACLIEGRSPSPWSGDPAAPLALERLPAGPVLLQLFVRGNPFRGSAGGDEPWPAALAQLLAAGRLAGLAVYGSPYLWEQLRPLVPAGIPAAFSPGQMPQAQAVLLERLGLAAAALEGGFTD